MKLLIALLTSMAVLTFSTPIALSADPPSQSAGTEEEISGAQRAGRVIADVLHLAGSALEGVGAGLQWTGKSAKKVATGAGKRVTKFTSKLSNRKKNKSKAPKE